MFTASRHAALSVLALAVLAPQPAQAQDPRPKKQKPAKPKTQKPRPKPKPAPKAEAKPESKSKSKSKKSEASEKAEDDARDDEATEKTPAKKKQADTSAGETQDRAERDDASSDADRDELVDEPGGDAETSEEASEQGTTLVTIDDGGPGEEVLEDEIEEDAAAAQGARVRDREAAAVEALWASLRGASLKKRILTIEAFIKKYPDSTYAIPLWEEAQSLRELIRKRAEPSLPDAPPRPSGATMVASEAGLPSADEPSVDFEELEARYERLQKLSVVKQALSPDDRDNPDEEVRPDSRIHDGGFIRFAFGPQWFNGSLERGFRTSAAAPNVPTAVDINGFGLTAEFVGGGAPVPGFILAARLAVTVALEPEAQLSDVFGTPDYEDPTLDDMIIPFTGLLMDVYPDPELGIHFFGTVGITMASVGGDDQVGSESFVGVGYGGGVGFEGWVADEWSVGIQARIDAAHMFGDENEATTADDVDTFVMVNPTLQLAFTFN